jgi:GT2 family glycosyltransferase
MATLSVLYIVRNEQETIARSVGSVSDIADEIVFVDTGSSDETMKLCRQFRKAKVFSHPWSQNFSAARNFGVSKCTKEWVLYVDGDELLDKGSASRVRAAIENARSNVSGFSMRVVDHPGAWNGPATEKPFFPNPQVRLFRRSPNIYFQGAVLESVRDSIKASGGAIDLLDAKVHHWLWRGKGASHGALRVKFYNRLGAKLEAPAGDAEAVVQDVFEEPPAPEKTAIVMCCMNALTSTKACVASIQANTSGHYSVYAVDNGSSDGTAHYLKETLGEPPMRMPSNVGVAKGRNHGAVEALKDPSVRYVCFLDNDTRVSPGWLEEMISVMEENQNLAVVGPISCSAVGVQNVASQFPRRNWEEAHPVATARSPRVVMTQKIGGFCMLFRADTLKRVGLFDESFGLYGYEADDMCRRLLAAGHEIGVANRVYVQHKGRATLDANRNDWNDVILRAGDRYGKKWNLEPLESPAPKSMDAATNLAPTEAPIATPRTTIVVSGGGDLKECVNSIMARTPNCEVVLVSGTPQAEALAAARPSIRLAPGRKAAIRESKNEYLAIVSPDVTVSQGWLNEMFAKLDAGLDMVGTEGWPLVHNECGMLGDSCVLARRRVFEEVGLPEDDKPGEIRELAKLSSEVATWGRMAAVGAQKVKRRIPASVDLEDLREYCSRPALPRERLSKAPKRLRLLYLGPRFDHGAPERGNSHEADNIVLALQKWDRISEMVHFDFVAVAQQYGTAGMSERLFDNARMLTPDVVLMSMQDENLDPTKEVMRKISATMRCKTIGWFSDSHFRFETYDRRWAPYLDFCVTTSAEAHRKYVANGFHGKAILTKRSASPACKRIEIPKSVDVSFVGPLHHDRREHVAALRAAGIAVHAPEGRMTIEEQVGLINRSRINLNLASVVDGKNKEVRGRNLDVAACGGFLLTNVTDELSDYLEIGSEAETFSSAAELVEKCRRFLSDGEAAADVAERAFKRASGYAWVDRLGEVFSGAGLP